MRKLLHLKSILRQNLQGWINLAESVDFLGETASKGRLRMFVNPEYERRENNWKMLYRAGKASTMAAVEVARDIPAAL